MSPSPDPSSERLAALFRLPLAEFTAARNALAAELKKAGEKAAAAGVAGLGKPSASAWAVNALYWKERPLFDAFLGAGARLVTAQRSGGADAFREAQKERKDALLGLMKKAEAALVLAGHGATPALLGRISQTLESLAVRGGAPEGMTLGQLVEDLEPPGFDAFAGLRFEAPPPSAPKAPRAESNAVAEVKARRAAIEEAREEVIGAEAEVRVRKKAMAEAAAAADKARAAQREAEEALSEASQKARRATETAEKAGFEARRVGTALAEAERALEAAKAAFDRKKREP